MAQPTSETIELARGLRERLAGSGLIPSFAKLYSQHTRLRAARPGLPGWREREASIRLSDAVRLLEAAFIEREAGGDNWQYGVRRAGELLEWLSHPELNPSRLPIRLLAAAAYQLAGYPARSAGLLNEDGTEGAESGILRSLLSADFPEMLRLLGEYWARTVPSAVSIGTGLPWDDAEAFSNRFHEWIVSETASALGVLCAVMRWGNESRLERALEKLSAVGDVLLYGDNPYSWLLARLCAEAAGVYVEGSMRHNLQRLSEGMNPAGEIALERYLRQSYQSCRVLAWPSQVRGIERLANRESFALCTPTGSGKTTVAELAILQSLFLEPESVEQSATVISSPLAIYLVPSRALAAEVEAKLSGVLRDLSDEQIVVTGLYGGTDWGPTDAWLTTEDRAVLICTYEKAEALMRFLGPLFLDRVTLIAIDEAHSVQFDGNRDFLRKAESRPLRLEVLGTRLLAYLDQNQSRVIALSAVASGVENALANWVAGQTGATPAKSSYRSTRQLIGRLECLPNRRFEIRYDLLDGASLEFTEGNRSDTPFIPNPFPPHPPAPEWEEGGPEKRIRPYLLWAAMHLAEPDERGNQRAVLISITQHIEWYTGDFLELLNSTWVEEEKPTFFQRPTDPEKERLWDQCLRSCQDYFGSGSREYRLLQKGIVVHHGNMPGLMARLLVEVIQERVVHLVVATSTLSEGVNLPFETVLIPILRRGSGSISIREFGNLVGRAGRPGFGTEGRSLVLLQPVRGDAKTALSIEQARNRYFSLVEKLKGQSGLDVESADAQSPLAELLFYLEDQWKHLPGSEAGDSFLEWLEQTAPLELGDDLGDESTAAIEALDSLDGLLLSAIVEIEQVAEEELSVDELEERLKRIWQRSYAHYASQEEARLEQLFIRRGRALKTKVYPTQSQRRRLYRTSLPPSSGNQLLDVYPRIREHLEAGREYILWSLYERFDYVRTVASQLGTVSKFRLREKAGGTKVDWQNVLRWWLDPDWAPVRPTVAQISNWHKYVNQNFYYRFNWGLGSIIALAIDEAYGGELRSPTLEDWPQTGLPWIVFWLKELIVWGTLEPVAAFLLARGMEVTRADAVKAARFYYEQFEGLAPDERLNAVTIRDWANTISRGGQVSRDSEPPSQIPVSLLRDFNDASSRQWNVVPVEIEDEIYWFDLAGFPLANCRRVEEWSSSYLDTHDFTLDASRQVVSSGIYL
jgi:hypothetical protein